jgi:N-terminal half of MaoC dehydratase
LVVNEESLITDEMRATIGKEGDPTRVEVDKTTIRWFARAVGHTDLIFYDEEYARSRGHRNIVAPPGFLGQPVYIPQQPSGATGARGAPRLPGMKVTRALNGGTEFEYYGQEVCAGDVLKRITKILDLQERSGSLGKMLIITTESRFYDDRDRLVASERSTSIVY